MLKNFSMLDSSRATSTSKCKHSTLTTRLKKMVSSALMAGRRLPLPCTISSFTSHDWPGGVAGRASVPMVSTRRLLGCSRR